MCSGAAVSAVRPAAVDQPRVLDADGAESGQHELGLEGEHHALRELEVAAGEHRQLVELEADAVADEAHLAGAVAHERLGQTFVGRAAPGPARRGRGR